MFTGQRYHCLSLEKINVSNVSPSKQHYILGKLTACPHRRKTNAARAEGSSLAASPIQHYRKIYAHNAVCLQSGRAWGILHVKNNSSNSSVRSLLIVSFQTFERGASTDIHTGRVKKESLKKMRNMFSSVEHVFYHWLCLFSLQYAIIDCRQ